MRPRASGGGGPRFLLTSALKDLRRRLTDAPALLIWVGIPAAIGGIILLVGGGDGPPTARLLLADRDDTFVSSLVAGALASGPLAEMIELEEVTEAAGRARMEEGEATALLVLPEGFSDAVLRERAAELLLVTNPAQRILPALVEDVVALLPEAAFYAQRLLGEELRAVAGGPPADASGFPDAAVAGISVGINRKVAALQGTLFPPALRVEVVGEGADGESAEGGNPAGGGFDLGRLFLPGILFMSILFIAQGMSDDVWEERERGTLRRVLSTPGGLLPFFLGKLLAGAVLVSAVAAVGLAIAAAFFGVAPVRLPAAFAWCIFTGTALLAFFFLLQLLAGSRRSGNVVATLVVFPLLMIGGSFFPFESMPEWMASIGRWTPNGLAVLRLTELLEGPPEAVGLLVATAGIGLPAALAVWLALRRIRGGFAIGA